MNIDKIEQENVHFWGLVQVISGKPKAQSGTALNHMKTAATFIILAQNGAATQNNQTFHLEFI